MSVGPFVEQEAGGEDPLDHTLEQRRKAPSPTNTLSSVSGDGKS
jgi:hypothetical protein